MIGLAKRGYGGLDTLIRATFQGPVHIVRQFISNPETQISAYHTNIGLSIAPEKTREARRITNIPGKITNLISRVWGLCGYVVWWFVGNKGFVVFLFSSVAPCKSVIENQKYKIVKGAI